MKITDQIYLAGSGKFGFELTNKMDCNVYAFDGGGEWALIDAGGGVEPERIEAELRRDGIAPERIAKVLLTHVHGDHAAGAAYFRSKYGAEIIVSSEAAPWLEQADHDKTSLNAAKLAGVYPADFAYPPCQADRTVREQDRIRIGRSEWLVLETPGHSRGHLGFLWESPDGRALFSGDTVFTGGKIVLQHIWDCSIVEYAQSLAKLHEYNIDRLFPGHGTFLMSRASEHIGLAHDRFSRLELPAGL